MVHLFEEAGYDVQITAADASASNGMGERPHRSIGDAIRSMLHGAGLEAKFWPYAFHHYLRIYNCQAHGDRDLSAFQICTGKFPDLAHLRTSGCRIYALPPRANGKRNAKLDNGTWTGIFLGYCKTLRNALYWDLDTKEVKTAQHVAFNETFIGEDFDSLPPHAKILCAVDMSELRPEEFEVPEQLLNLDVSTSSFVRFKDFTLPVDFDADSPLGIEFACCPRLHRAYVSAIDNCSPGHKLKAFRKHQLSSYIVSLDEQPIFSLADIEAVLANLRPLRDRPTELKVTFAPPHYSVDIDYRPSPIHLRVADLRHIHAINLVDGEGMNSSEYIHTLHTVESTLDDPVLSIDDDSPPGVAVLLRRLQTEAMTAEERKLKSFTCRNLQKLSNWASWDTTFDKQLDSHHDSGTTGEPVLRPKGINGRPANILRIQWSNLVEPDGVRKARACIDGSPRAAPWLREGASTYASCIEMPCM